MPGKPTFVCSVILSKTDGITVKVENPGDQITQTFYLDGTAITTTVKGPQSTSTITQKQDSVAIKCDAFSVDAGTIDMKSSKATTHDSKDKYTVTASQDMSFTSSGGKATLEASAADTMVTSGGGDVKIKATADANMKGLTVTQEASTTASLKGGTELKLDGGPKASLKGMMTEITADVSLKAKGLMADYTGSAMTTVKGSIVMIG